MMFKAEKSKFGIVVFFSYFLISIFYFLFVFIYALLIPAKMPLVQSKVPIFFQETVNQLNACWFLYIIMYFLIIFGWTCALKFFKRLYAQLTFLAVIIFILVYLQYIGFYYVAGRLLTAS